MAHKPEIQYVERFYVYGSEVAVQEQQEQQAARQAEKARKQLQVHKIYVDLGALLWTAAAILLLGAMLFSAVNLSRMWQEKEQMAAYVSQLQLENSDLQHNYRIGYDLDEIAVQAQEMGLVPENQVEQRYIRVTVPQHQKGWTTWGNIQWFFEGLFE